MSRCLCGHDEFEHESNVHSTLCMVTGCDCEAFEWDHITEEDDDD